MPFRLLFSYMMLERCLNYTLLKNSHCLTLILALWLARRTGKCGMLVKASTVGVTPRRDRAKAALKNKFKKMHSSVACTHADAAQQ